MNTNDSLTVKNSRAKKMMLWFGMISMSMTFAGLTSAYVVSSSRSDWIQQIELPFAFTLSTLLIILSSGSFYGGLKMIQSEKIKAAQGLLFLTLGLAIGFIIFSFKVLAQSLNKDIILLDLRVPLQHLIYMFWFCCTYCI